MDEPCLTTNGAKVMIVRCLKWKKPRAVLTFCLLFSITFAIVSSVFLYYPGDLTVDVPAPQVSMMEEDKEKNTVGVPNHNRPLHKARGSVSASVERKLPTRNDESSSANMSQLVNNFYMNSEHHRNEIHHHGHESHAKVEEIEGRRISHVSIPNGGNTYDLIMPAESPLHNKHQSSNFSRVINNRIVHFDLKGSPPKVTYLKEILRLAKRAGITGVLFEWEDTFPWKGELQNISLRDGGYSTKQAKELISFAESLLGLDVIPLVQTFGHVEFVLKGEKFKHLRELEEDPQSFCPSKNETYSLIYEMVDQILELHKNSKFVHIGCDEVYNLRMCSICTTESDSRDDLFLKHVTKVAKYVRSKGRIPIIWDDMLRSIPTYKLQDADFGQLVEPMVWVYAEEVDRFVGWESWEKYEKVFPTIWAAAAYKGAFGERLRVPPLSRHAENVARWIEVITRESPKWSLGVGGLVLTGWQRYDHFAVLCELLPASVPSLIYTTLLLSTPSTSANPEIRNRVFYTSEPKLTSTSVLSSTSGPNLTIKNFTESLPVIDKRSVDVKRKNRIPHPRTIMARDRNRLQQFGTYSKNFIRTYPLKSFTAQDIISREFIQILDCPVVRSGSHTISSMLKESDSELTFASRCLFPGVAFFRALFRLNTVLESVNELQTRVEKNRGWLTSYNVRHNYSLPFRMNEVILREAPRVKENLAITAKSVYTSLSPLYDNWTIDEWIEQNVWEAWNVIDRLENDGNNLKSIKVWDRRPLKSPRKMYVDLMLNEDVEVL